MKLNMKKNAYFVTLREQGYIKVSCRNLDRISPHKMDLKLISNTLGPSTLTRVSGKLKPTPGKDFTFTLELPMSQ